jgi:tetratricopeptide (TPR) repeat protein
MAIPAMVFSFLKHFVYLFGIVVGQGVFSLLFQMTLVRTILLWGLFVFVSAETTAAVRCFEQIIFSAGEACDHGSLKAKPVLQKVICDFELECPEHNQAIEWQELPTVAEALADFSSKGASSDDLAHWHILRARQFLFSGQYSSALIESDDALVLLSAPADQLMTWYALYFKGIALKHQYRYDEATDVLGEALNSATRMNDDRYRLYVLYAISELMTVKEQHDQALEYYREFHRLHQVLHLKSAEIKAERDALLMASVNRNTEAGTTAWQWQMVAVFLMLLIIGTAIYFRRAIARLWAAEQKPVRFEGIKTERQPNLTFGIKLPNREAVTDEEIMVDEVKVERLAALRKARLLTQEDWELFENDFSHIYPEFLAKLRYVHPEISAAEEKLSCLLRIHYGTKDVARTLAISPQSVSVSRYRLRKRMGLPLETTLEEYIMGF